MYANSAWKGGIRVFFLPNCFIVPRSWVTTVGSRTIICKFMCWIHSGPTPIFYHLITNPSQKLFWGHPYPTPCEPKDVNAVTLHFFPLKSVFRFQITAISAQFKCHLCQHKGQTTIAFLFTVQGPYSAYILSRYSFFFYLPNDERWSAFLGYIKTMRETRKNNIMLICSRRT